MAGRKRGKPAWGGMVSRVSDLGHMACTRCSKRVPIGSLQWVSVGQGTKLAAYCVACQGLSRRPGRE